MLKSRGKSWMFANPFSSGYWGSVECVPLHSRNETDKSIFQPWCQEGRIHLPHRSLSVLRRQMFNNGPTSIEMSWVKNLSSKVCFKRMSVKLLVKLPHLYFFLPAAPKGIYQWLCPHCACVWLSCQLPGTRACFGGLASFPSVWGIRWRLAAVFVASSTAL